jgi:hypothetical protein
VVTEQERAVFNEHMARWQAHLDRYRASGDPRLIFDPDALAGVKELPGYATGSASWGDAQHLCAWFHWLRYEALGDGRGGADREAAVLLFRDQYRVRPLDLPKPLRQQLDAEFQRLFESVMAQVTQETRRRRANRRRLQELLGPLEMICNFTAYGDSQYLDRVDARAQVAELARSDMAPSYKEEALKARTEKGRRPPPASPPWRPFDWGTYFGN